MTNDAVGAKSSPQVRSFGKYELQSPLGSGGMATVYAARLVGPHGATKRVALKLVHPHLSMNEGFVSMFILEMQVAMALQHRNIIQTFDAGVEQGRHFMAMELIDGCTARELMRRHREPLPLDIVLFIGMEICEALHHIHTATPQLTGQPGAVIHRDVSPSNILISTAGDVKLADFGVARAMRTVDDSASEIVKGKLAYMAPEQARGRACASSDVYSLGAVLYEMLTGKPPRPGLSIDELVGPLELVPPRRLRAEIPEALEALISRTLADDVSPRPADGRQLRGLLAEIHAKVSRLPSDPHGRLRDLVASLPTPPVDRNAAAIAAAMLDQAAQLTEVSKSPADDVATMVERPLSPPSAQTESGLPGTGKTLAGNGSAAAAAGEMPRTVIPSSGDDKPRSRQVLYLLALGVAAVAGVLVFWLLSTTMQHRASRSRASMPRDAAVSPAQEAKLHVVARDKIDGDGRVGAGRDGLGQDAAVVEDAPRRRARRQRGRDIARGRRKKVRRAGLQPGQPVTVTKAEGKTGTTKVPIAPVGWGKLNLNAVPWANVYLEGKQIGTTPLEGKRLKAGRHRLRLHNPKRNLERSFTIEISAGKTLHRVVRLGGG